MAPFPDDHPSKRGPAPTAVEVGGDPPALATAGDKFRDAANALGRIQNAFYDGGETDAKALKLNDLGDQHNIGKMLQDITKKFYELTWSANLQVEDAALNFWDVAKAFKKADATVVYHDIAGPGAPRIKHLPDGTTAYIDDGPRLPDEGQEIYDQRNTVLIVDKEGKIISTGATGHDPVNQSPVDRPAKPAVPLPPPEMSK